MHLHTARVTAALAIALTIGLVGCSSAPKTKAATKPKATSPAVATAPAIAASAAPALRPLVPERPEPKPTPVQPLIKVGFVYVGPIGDAGWTFQHDQARKALEKAFGGKVLTSYVEGVSESSKGEALKALAAQGHQLVFATTSGYWRQVEQVARDLPDLKLEITRGHLSAPNIRNYSVRTYESAYLAGMLAGGMTKGTHLGVVASIPTPEIISVINAYTLGARAMNPKLGTRVVWVNQWCNPPEEAAAAQKLFDGGVDVIYQTTDSSAVMQTAERLGKRAIAWDSDLSVYGPQAQLGATILNWTPYYVKSVQDALDGKWAPSTTSWGLDHGVVDLRYISVEVPRAVQERIKAAREGIVQGTLKIWRGPLRDNRNKLLIPEGVVARDAQIDWMKAFVQGVEGPPLP